MARKSKSKMRRSKIRYGRKQPNKTRLKRRKSHLRRKRNKNKSKSKVHFMSGGWGGKVASEPEPTPPKKGGFIQRGGSDTLSGWS